MFRFISKIICEVRPPPWSSFLSRPVIMGATDFSTVAFLANGSKADRTKIIRIVY